MLSRASSDAAGRLRRAKSTSSTHGRHRSQPSEPSDPELTRQHALRAATRAYERANGMPLGALDHRETRTHAQTDRGERRSTEQNGLQSRPSLPNLPTGQVPRLAQRRRLEGQTGYGAGWTGNDSVLHQPSRATERRSNVGRDSSNNTGTTDLTMSREVCKVRHSRSSYSEHSVTAPFHEQFKRDIPRARYNPDIGTSSKEVTQAHDYENKRTLTTLAGESSRPCMKRPKSTEHVIAAARDKYFQTFQTAAQSGSRLPPTLPIISEAEFTRATHRRAESVPAWKGSEIKGDGTENVTSGQKGKGFSTSFRKSFKKLFRRGPAQDDLPLQQVEAGRLHFQIDSETAHQLFQDTSRHSEDMFANTGSQTRRLRNVHSQSSIRSRSSSNGSVRHRTHSPHDSSRVTSWNTSTAANTITTQGTKRLSVIKEDGGPHRSAKVPGTHPQLQPECGNGRKPRRVGSKLSIYSALMRRIDESNLDSGVQTVKVEETDGFTISGAAKRSSHSRFDSLASTATRLTKSTIRAVASRETFRNFSGSSRTSSTVVHTEAAANVSSDARGVGTDAAAPISVMDHNATGTRVEGDYVTPTRQQLASRLQRSDNRWKAPLDDVRSGFFPSHSRRIMYTDNPYELAPRQPQVEQRSSPVKSNEFTVQKDRGTPPAISSDGAIRNEARLMSPSVYSCDTSGQSPLRNSSTVSLAGSYVGVTGTAVVTPTQPVAKYAIGAKAARLAKAQHMPMQSKDWRAWTAEKVAELEAEVKVSGILIAEDHHPQPRRTGHRRERAQINDDSGETAMAAALSTPPLRRKRTRPRLSENEASKATAKMNERFPYLETGRKASSENKKPKQRITPPRTEKAGSAKDAERTAANSSPKSVLRPQANGQPRQTSNIPKPNLKRPQSTSQLPSTVRNGYELTPPTAFPYPSPTARMTAARTPPQVPKRPTPKSKDNTPPSRITLQPSEPTTAYRPARGSVSAANLAGQYQAGNLTRKPFATAAAMQEDADGMMRRISAGPWVDESSPAVASGADAGVAESAKWSWKNEGNKENVSPAVGGAGSIGYESARSRRAVNVFEQVRRERGAGWEKEGWGGGGGGGGNGRVGRLSPAFI